MSLTERTAWDCNQKRIEWTSPSMMGDPWMLMIQPSWWSLHNGEPLYIHEHIIYLVNPDEPWVCPRKFIVRESLATDPCHEYTRNVLATQCDQGENLMHCCQQVKLLAQQSSKDETSVDFVVYMLTNLRQEPPALHGWLWAGGLDGANCSTMA